MSENWLVPTSRIDAKLAKAGARPSGTTGRAICPPPPAQLSRLQLCLAVTLSGALINNVLTLGRKRPDLTFRNSWEVRRWWEGLSGSQLTVALPESTQQATGGTLDSSHQHRLQTCSLEIFYFVKPTCGVALNLSRRKMFDLKRCSCSRLFKGENENSDITMLMERQEKHFWGFTAKHCCRN